MQKYKCPKCGYKGITTDMPSCPECGKKFNWKGATTSTKKAKKDTSKNYLMNFYYWFQMLTFICPVAGVVIWHLNKDYKNNIIRRKAELYDRYTKKVITSVVIWVLLIIILAVIAGISMNQARQGA